MIVATAGHVDHGKTRLVHALTGIETDRLEEEQTRGLTIDLGFAYTTLGDHRVGFIDVPGHIRFINNMLAGVSVIDLGLLVVAADDGPMPQTREHLAVLDLLGIDRGLVAITKTDRVAAERVDAVVQEVRALVADTTLHDADIVPVSSETGDGVDKIEKTLRSLATERKARNTNAMFRLAIDRAFSLRGAGVVVTGSVFSGEIAVGDEVFLLPQAKRVRVRSLHRQNAESDRGAAGDRVALNLAGDISLDDIHRGNWVTSVAVPSSQRVDARIRVLPDGKPLRHFSPVHIHSATSHITGRIATLEGRSIAPGETGFAQLVLASPINVWRGDKIILRNQSASATLGGGEIVDVHVRARGRTRPDRLQALRALSAATPEARLQALLACSPGGFDWRQFVDAEVTPATELEHLLDSCGGEHASGIAIERAGREALEAGVRAAVERWLGENPSADGLEREKILALLDLRPALVDVLLDRLRANGTLERDAGKYRLPGRKAALDPAAAKLWDKVEPILKENPTRPPVIHDLASEINLPPKAIEKLLGQCAHLGLLVRPSPNRFFLPEGVDTLYRQAREAAEAGGGTFTVKDFRDITGIGRNLSIEILEYFDRTGRTVRMGDERKLQTTRTG